MTEVGSTGGAAPDPTNPKMTARCQVHILPDEPASEDQLGSLESVASAIAGLVDNTYQVGGKTILLEGTWGSGKSSVVRMLRERFRNNDRVAVSVFDAWGHEGDPLRRSFIESLARSLKQKQWASPDAWNRELEQLCGRLERTTTRVQTGLTTSARGAAIGTMFVPLGVVMLAELMRASAKPGLVGPAWLATAGVVFTLAPLLLGFAGWVESVRQWNRQQQRGENSASKPRLWDVFDRSELKDTHIESYKSADPTSIEFCQMFDCILRDVLGEGATGTERDKRTLVLVIDNLDRVYECDARALWSTMRGAFGEEDRASRPWVNRVWLVVPMDREAAENLWRSGKDEAGVHYITKTFQARMHVPAPVLTSWTSFLAKKLDLALPDHRDNEEEKRTIIALFGLLNEKATERVTPREVIQFVNRLATLDMMWHGVISLRVLAAYALIERKLPKKERDFVTQLPLGPQALSILRTPDWQIDIARVHFNVPDRDQVSQIVLAPEVRRALVNADLHALDAMSNFPGFSRVAACIVVGEASDWSAGIGQRLTNAANALAHIDAKSTREYKEAWRALAAKAPSGWPEFAAREGEGIVTILRRNPDRLSTLGAEFVQSFCTTGLANASSVEVRNARPWLEGCLVVIRHLRDEKQTEVVKNSLLVPGDVTFYIAVMAALGEHPLASKVAKYFKGQHRPEEYTNVIAMAAGDKKLDDSYAAAVAMMVQVPSSWDWTSVLSGAYARCGANDLTPPETDAIIAILTVLRNARGQSPYRPRRSCAPSQMAARRASSRS